MDVIGHAAVAHRVVSAGVVAQRTTDRGPVLRRGIGGEGHPARGRVLGHPCEGREHDARFDVGDTGRLVDGEDAVHVPGEVDDDTGADGVTRHRRPAPSADQRDPGVAAGTHHRHDVVHRPRKDHGRRWHPVVGGVVGVLGRRRREVSIGMPSAWSLSVRSRIRTSSSVEETLGRCPMVRWSSFIACAASGTETAENMGASVQGTPSATSQFVGLSTILPRTERTKRRR